MASKPQKLLLFGAEAMYGRLNKYNAAVSRLDCTSEYELVGLMSNGWKAVRGVTGWWLIGLQQQSGVKLIIPLALHYVNNALRRGWVSEKFIHLELKGF